MTTYITIEVTITDNKYYSKDRKEVKSELSIELPDESAALVLQNSAQMLNGLAQSALQKFSTEKSEQE